MEPMHTSSPGTPYGPWLRVISIACALLGALCLALGLWGIADAPSFMTHVELWHGAVLIVSKGVILCGAGIGTHRLAGPTRACPPAPARAHAPHGDRRSMRTGAPGRRAALSGRA
jgi:hypothetical protein